jgi:hypothetical protein
MLSRRRSVDAAARRPVTPRTLTGVNVKKSAPRSSDGTWALVLLAVAAVWLGLSFRSMNAFLAAQVEADPGSVPNLVMSLSATVIGAVFAGAVAGHLVTVLPMRWLSGLPRLVTAAGGGVLVGLVAAAAGYSTFAATPAVAAIVAGVAGLSALLGGCAAAPKNTDAVAAGLAATVVLLAFMFLRGWFDEDLLNLLTRQPDTYRWIGIAGGVVAGMCAGLTAYALLRRRRSATKLSGYLLAGAAPGALWLLSEIAIRIAAAFLVNTTSQIDQLSDLLMGQTLEAQLNGSLATLFAGGTTAVLAFGMLLPKKKPVNRPTRAAAKPSAAAPSVAPTQPADTDTAAAEQTATPAPANEDRAGDSAATRDTAAEKKSGPAASAVDDPAGQPAEPAN